MAIPLWEVFTLLSVLLNLRDKVLKYKSFQICKTHFWLRGVALKVPHKTFQNNQPMALVATECLEFVADQEFEKSNWVLLKLQATYGRVRCICSDPPLIPYWLQEIASPFSLSQIYCSIASPASTQICRGVFCLINFSSPKRRLGVCHNAKQEIFKPISRMRQEQQTEDELPYLGSHTMWRCKVTW